MFYFLCKNSGIHHALCPNPGKFCPKSAVKAAFEKKGGEKSSDDFEESPLSRALRRASSPEGTPYGDAAKFLVSTKAVPLGKVAANEVSRRKG